MKKLLSKSIIGGIVLALFFPVFVSAGTDYTYRSTVIGSGIKKINDSVYEIVNERNVFSEKDSFYALSRIFKIEGIQKFQFKYELRGAENREMFSRVYEPKGRWWSEIWYYDNFGALQAGNYFLNVYLSIDNGEFRKLDSKAFSVVSGGAQNYNTNYQNSNSKTYSAGTALYHYDFIQTGKGIRDQGRHVYDIVSPSDRFESSEDVYVLLKLSDLRGIDNFSLRFDVYDGYKLLRSNTTPLASPGHNTWEYNYAWANLGKLPEGKKQIRAYIRTDGNPIKRIATHNIEVTDQRYVSDYRPGYRYDDGNFDYNWTMTDDRVYYLGNYRYSINGSRDVFARDQEVKVLTRLSAIKNIDHFKIRHELKRNGSFVSKKESDVRRPNNNYWEYNYFQSSFGKLGAGNYEVRTFISIEGDIWKYLGSKEFIVSSSTYTDSDYSYDWTQVGLNFNPNTPYGYQNINYPLTYH